MRSDSAAAPVVAVGAAWWLFTELGAAWGPSLITVFGQAASTPAELMGLFALGCALASFVVLAATRRGRAPLVALGLALAARLVLATVPGGEVQLWASSLGVAAALAWLAHLVGRHGGALAPGLATGWLLHATAAAGGGTWLAVWRTDLLAWATVALLLGLGVVTARSALRPTAAPSRRQAWSALPLALVAGIAVVNAGRASTVDPDVGPFLLVVGCGLAVLVAGRAPSRLAAGVVAVAAVATSLYGTATVDGVPGSLASWTLVALVVGPAALVSLLTPDRDGRAAGGVAVLGGAVLWVVLFFAYYAGYDLGYRADALVVATTAVVAAAALRRTPRSGAVLARPAAAVLVAAALLAGGLGAWAQRLPDGVAATASPSLRVAAWNLRMGYGLDGRFDPRAVAAVLEGADVVLLSEVDRGWLLNGGQDQLAVLARLTGTRLHFGPAADPVWGDAVLTSLPVNEVRGVPLASYGAVTGAGALAVRVEVAGGEAWFVSTHVQPTDDRADGTVDQARDLAALVDDLAADGTPVVLGGDLNFEPGTPSWQALLDAGLTDALAEVRPLPTMDAGDPVEEIDHVLHRGPWSVLEAGSADTEASDHLPVWAVLRLTVPG